MMTEDELKEIESWLKKAPIDVNFHIECEELIAEIRRLQQPKELSCPFCNDDDFDLMAQRDKKDEPSADCRFCCECLISMPPRTWSVCKCGMCICDNCQCAKCLWTAKPKGKDKKDAD